MRGNRIAMIFQDPMTSVNPVMTIGRQLTEPLIVHQGMTKAAAWEHAVNMLEKVGITAPQQRMKEYPHQFSGGMRQRIMIAMALSCNPALLIADEPTTALDVTIQAQVLELIPVSYTHLRRNTPALCAVICRPAPSASSACSASFTAAKWWRKACM